MVAVVDHALGVLFVVVETITVRIAQIVIEGKKHTKATDVGEAVVAEEVSRVDLEVVPLNHLIEIKLRVETNTKEVFSLSSINHSTVKANHRIRGSRDAESLT